MSGPPRLLLEWATRIYPRTWRERYGREFEAMLEDLPERGLRWNSVWDISKGAIAMRAIQGPANLMKVTAIFAVAGLIVAGGIAFAIPDSFVSMSLVKADSSIDGEILSNSLQRTLTDKWMQGLIGKYGLYQGKANAVELLKRDFVVRPIKRGRSGEGAFHVGVRHADPETARRINVELTEAILKAQAGLSLLDATSLPQSPIEPNRPIIAIVGCTAGAAIGLILALWRRRYARTASGTA